MVENIVVCFSNITTTTSECSSCSYGPLCQFTTAYHGITSFQAVLCSIERIPISIVISIFLLGSLLNLLAIGTFCRPKPRERGSGIYRLWISLIGQAGLIVIVSHILLEKFNHEIISCYILEYLRKAIHALYDSLTACVALERTMLIYLGLSFNKVRSRRVAKLIIPILIIYHFVSIHYEPFSRHVIYSFNRYWCILTIPHRSLLNFYSALNILHFILPYLVNLILPIFWIIALTKHKATLYKNHSIWANMKKVLTTYRPTLITTYALVLLNTPRFISMFYLTCIKQQWQNTAYMMAYFLSLIPLLANLPIFVLLSPTYRPELLGFIQKISKYRFRNQYNIA